MSSICRGGFGPFRGLRGASGPGLIAGVLALALGAMTAAAGSRPASGQPPAQRAGQPVQAGAAAPATRAAPGVALLPPANHPGVQGVRFDVIVGARLHVSATEVLENASVVMRDGVIVAVDGTPPRASTPPAPASDQQGVGEKAKVPASDEAPPAEGDPEVPASVRAVAAGARVWDGRGLHVYAGFVDPFVEVDAPQPDADTPGAHWSARVTPRRTALDGKGIDEATAKLLRSQGFAAGGLSPRGGVIRGHGAAVALARPEEDPSLPRPAVYARGVYLAASLDTASGDGSDGRWGGYPNSQMGAIALLRQALADAAWWAGVSGGAGGVGGAPDAVALAAIGAGPGAVPLAFEVSDELETLRVLKIAREFGRRAVVVTGGTDFRRLAAVAEAARAGTGPARLVIPLNFPEKPRVGTIGEAEAVDLRELMTWEQAPTNPRRLVSAGLAVSLTTSKLRDRGKFLDNLRTAGRHGLTESQAVAALTTAPAELLGLGGSLGRVAVGYRANLVVLDGPLMDKKAKVRDVWIDGQRHEVNPAPVRLTGLYALELDPSPKSPGVLELLIDKDNGVTVRKTAPAEAAPPPPPAEPAQPAGEPEAKPQAKPAPKEVTVKAKSVSVTADRVSFVIEHDPLGQPGVFTLSGVIDRGAGRPVTLTGEGTRADGERFTWTARRTGPLPPPPSAKPGDKPADKPGDRPADKPADKPDADKPAEGGERPDPVAGVWSCTIEGPQPLPPGGLPVTLTLRRDGGALSASLSTPMGGGEARDVREPGPGAVEFAFSPGGGEFTAAFSLRIAGERLTGTARGPVEATITGTRTGPAGGRSGDAGKDSDDDSAADVPADLPGLPFGAYALPAPPAAERVAFVNATVWTSGPAGVIERGAVVIGDGRITYVGSAAGLPRLDASVRVVDLAGRHITPGIIDCHSHTGISRGVNESGQAVTAEVRIQDVTNPDAMNWYRQLAGGVTAVNSLHGSANAIGGQNCVNKIRWGCLWPDDMHLAGRGSYSDADPFTAPAPAGSAPAPGIKFALGENPKGSNAGDRATWRYPQTRMGVEAQIRDRFVAARRYADERRAWVASGAAPADMPRRDLELEALAEVLDGRRLIHCHSYRQDEIQMLADLCGEFGITIGTYQHNLEGYKVAEHVRRQAIGASLFSDWWAFKVEVQDAIPYAGPIMHEQGVVVSYNSDSDELARRMHVEAGKAHKYSLRGDGTRSVSPEEALKFVTINPARQLKIDSRVGSIEAGKDADLAIWSGPPLSSLSRCEQTWIDGAMYFSLERDAELRARNAAERTRLIQKLLRDGKPASKPEAGPSGGVPSRGPRGGRPGGGLIAQMNADAREARREHLLDMVRRGINPADHRSGQCCDE